MLLDYWSLLQNPTDELIERVEFPRKGNIAHKAEQRHFKDFPKPDDGNSIIPFWERQEIPHLPKESTNQRAERQCDELAIIAARTLLNERGPLHQRILRVHQQKQPHPNESKCNARE